jgi:hypothetical protein
MLSCWFADTLHAFDSLLALSPFTAAMTSAMVFLIIFPILTLSSCGTDLVLSAFRKSVTLN